MVSTLAPLLAALAAVLVLGALLWPLWRGGSRRTYAAAVALATLATPLLYLAVGTPQALDARNVATPRALAGLAGALR